MGRTAEEMEDVTLLGNKNVKYSMDYAPEMLQTFINKHQDNDYFVKFNCPEYIFHMFQAKEWLKANLLSFIF